MCQTVPILAFPALKLLRSFGIAKQTATNYAIFFSCITYKPYMKFNIDYKLNFIKKTSHATKILIYENPPECLG